VLSAWLTGSLSTPHLPISKEAQSQFTDHSPPAAPPISITPCQLPVLEGPPDPKAFLGSSVGSCAFNLPSGEFMELFAHGGAAIGFYVYAVQFGQTQYGPSSTTGSFD